MAAEPVTHEFVDIRKSRQFRMTVHGIPGNSCPVSVYSTLLVHNSQLLYHAAFETENRVWQCGRSLWVRSLKDTWTVSEAVKTCRLIVRLLCPKASNQRTDTPGPDLGFKLIRSSVRTLISVSSGSLYAQVVAIALVQICTLRFCIPNSLFISSFCRLRWRPRWPHFAGATSSRGWLSASSSTCDRCTRATVR